MVYFFPGNRVYAYQDGKLFQGLVTGTVTETRVMVLLQNTVTPVEMSITDLFPDLGDSAFISFPMESLDDEEREWLRNQLRALAGDVEPAAIVSELDQERQWLRDLLGTPPLGVDYHGPRQHKRGTHARGAHEQT